MAAKVAEDATLFSRIGFAWRSEAGYGATCTVSSKFAGNCAVITCADQTLSRPPVIRARSSRTGTSHVLMQADTVIKYLDAT